MKNIFLKKMIISVSTVLSLIFIWALTHSQEYPF